MKKISAFMLLVILIFNIAGCAPLLFVAAGGVAVYATNKDTIEGDTDKPYTGLWNSAVALCNARGSIKQQDNIRGYIQAQIGSSQVWIKISRLTRLSNRIKISARKFHLPDVGLAQDLFGKILEGA